MQKKRILIVIIVFLIVAGISYTAYHFYPKKTLENKYKAPFTDIKSAWVDSLIMNMSIEQKIGNLMILDFGTVDSANYSLLDYAVNKYFIGGVIFDIDSVEQHIKILNNYQSTSNVPLFICSKNGTSYPSYLRDITPFPNSNALNAITDDSLIVEYIKYVSNIDSLLGINLSFNMDLFSKYDFLNYFHDKNIISSYYSKEISRFANDTGIFSKIDLSFKKFIDKGVSAIYIDNDFKLDSANKEGLFLSKYLTDDLGHKGLIVSGDMMDVTDLGLSEIDMFIVDNKLPTIIEIIKQQIALNKLSIETLDKKVRKVLMAKSWTGLEDYKKIELDTIKPKLNTVYSKGLSRRMFEASITLIKNEKNLIPAKDVTSEYFVYNFNAGNSQFNDLLKYYVEYKSRSLNFDSISVQKMVFYSDYTNFIITLNDIEVDTFALNYLNKSIIWQKKNSNITIVNFGNPEVCKYLPDCQAIIQAYGNSEAEMQLTSQLIFGGIKATGKLPEYIELKDYKYIKTNKTRLGYTIPEEFNLSSDTLSYIDSVVFDGISRHAFPGCQVFVAKKGKVIFNKSYGYHTYDKVNKVQWDDLYDIASITKVAGTTLATMKMVDQGKLSLTKKIEEYFKDTYIEYTKIKPDTVINIDTINFFTYKNAKRFIEDKDTIHLSDSIIVVYDTLFYRVTPKLNVFKRTVAEMLIHKSGLPPSMPILRYILYRDDTNITLPDTFIVGIDSVIIFDTLPKRKDTVAYLYNKYYAPKYMHDTSNVQIARGMYLRKEYQDTLWIDTKQIRVYSKAAYMYSDVNAIMVQQVIDTINDSSIDKYLQKYFYKPLGLRTMGYLPLERFKRDRITPTEDDKYWRHQLVHGYVHDPSAALIGGIAGNAGLFSNAHDLGIIFQMLLNGGTYGGKRFIDNKTVNKFTNFQPDSHRGLGFDKANNDNIVAYDAPADSWGHTGFTGCCVWVDPHEELVYVFLSNRVHPSVKNWTSNKLEIRQRVHQVVYDAIAASESKK